MIRIDEAYEQAMIMQLEELGFSNNDARRAIVDVFKVAFIRFAQTIESHLSDKEKRVFSEMAEDKTEEEVFAFMNRYFHERSLLDAKEAEKILNELWDSYIETMKGI